MSLVEIRGYAARWAVNRVPDDRGQRIRLAAHSLLTAGRSVPFTLDHDPSRSFASTTDGTLALKADGIGLRAVIKLDTRTHAGIITLIESGRITGLSVSLPLARTSHHVVDADGRTAEVVRQSTVTEVSLVGIPCGEGCWAWSVDSDPALLSDEQLWARRHFHTQEAMERLRKRPAAPPQRATPGVAAIVDAPWFKKAAAMNREAVRLQAHGLRRAAMSGASTENYNP